MAHIIVVTSALGGVGKSYTAISLADALAKSGKRILLLDLNHPYCTIAFQLGLAEKKLFELSDILYSRADFDGARISLPGGFDYIPGSSTGEDISGKLFGDFLDTVSALYTAIIIDCPAKGSAMLNTSFCRGGTAVAVSTLSKISVQSTAVLSDELKKTAADNAFLLINGFQNTKGSPLPELDSVIDSAQLQLIGITPSDSTHISEIRSGARKISAADAAFGRISQRLYGQNVPLPDLLKM